MADTPTSVQKSEEEWRAILSPEQFRILRQKGTEYVYIYLCPNLILSLEMFSAWCYCRCYNIKEANPNLRHFFFLTMKNKYIKETPIYNLIIWTPINYYIAMNFEVELEKRKLH